MNDSAREPLTRGAILNAAIGIADSDGLAKLTMRKLSAELGFEAMSLYNHIANKTDLLAAMLDQIVEQIPLPEIDDDFDWKAASRQNALDLRALLERHPWSVELWLKALPGPRRLALAEWQLAALATSDLSPEAAHMAFHALSNHVVGYVMQQEAMIDFGGDDPEVVMERVIESMDSERHAHMLEHVEQHRQGDIGESFEYVLDLLIDGLAAR